MKTRIRLKCNLNVILSAMVENKRKPPGEYKPQEKCEAYCEISVDSCVREGEREKERENERETDDLRGNNGRTRGSEREKLTTT